MLGSSDILDNSVIDTTNNRQAVKKDGAMTLLIPNIISECSLIAPAEVTGNCSSSSTIEIVGTRLGLVGDVTSIIAAAKTATGCKTEKCVIAKVLPNTKTLSAFKITGPLDNKLLTNVNIDNILNQWATHFEDFTPYNFNMVDYQDYSFDDGHIITRPDSLATRRMTDNYNKGFRTMACVINSDTYFGQGKHWMALFVDMRNTRANSPTKATIEFFNSSGNAPTPSWLSWMEKTRLELESLGIPADIIRVTNRKQQKSRTECGVYSLFYIWSRLNNLPYTYYRQTVVPDQLMFEFRQHIFEGSSGKFSWDEYIKKVAVTWE